MEKNAEKIAITEFIRDLVRKRYASGKETLQQIADDLGLKSHASVSQYINPKHTVKPAEDVQRRVAQIHFDDSWDALRDAALEHHRKKLQESDFPAIAYQAIGILSVREPNNVHLYEGAVRDLLAFHKADLVDVAVLTRQIETAVAENKGKSVGKSSAEDIDAGVTKKRAGKKS